MNTREINLGLRAYAKAIKLIFASKLWLFFFFPLILNVLVFWGGIKLVAGFTDDIQLMISGWLNFNEGDFFLSEYVGDALSWLLGIGLKILYFFIFAYFGGYVILALMSPVLAYVSERAEQIITGKEYPFDFFQFLKDTLRGIIIALRNFCIEILLTIVLLLFGLIPVIGWFSAIFLFFVTAYFYGFSFVDYVLERRKKNIKESVQFMRQHKGLVIANGSLFALILLIPFIGSLLAGFISVISAVAATYAINAIERA